MNTIMPALGDAHVLEFCASVASGSDPYVVQCFPLLGEPFSECFSIVPKQIVAHGGYQLTGWAIWEFLGVYIEAEFHSVWQGPDGQIVDISPRPIYFPNIAFLPDPQRQYAGRQVDNIRKPLVRDQDVIRFLYLCRRRFEILNQGDLADQHGAISLTDKAMREFMNLEKEMAKLQRRLDRRYAA
jgi:hypothetical protein